MNILSNTILADRCVIKKPSFLDRIDVDMEEALLIELSKEIAKSSGIPSKILNLEN